MSLDWMNVDVPYLVHNFPMASTNHVMINTSQGGMARVTQCTSSTSVDWHISTHADPTFTRFVHL